MSNIIVRHCAPTLAGMKIGNMFTMKYKNLFNLVNAFKRIKGKLNQKGISICILKTGNGKALLYVYRKTLLAERLQTKKARDILKSLNYPVCSFDRFTSDYHTETSKVIAFLKTRIALSEEFPHEIGLFLGYPLEDVIGFMKNRGSNSLAQGHWKVYANPEKAKCTFEKYRKCTSVYTKVFASNSNLLKLVVTK